MQHFCFTAPALPSVFGTLEDEMAHSLQVEQLASPRGKVVELNDGGNVLEKSHLPESSFAWRRSRSVCMGKGS